MLSRRVLVSLLLAVAVALTTHATAAPAPTIAIAYFDNNTGRADLDPLAKGLADMLITDLSALAGLQIVEREKLNQVLAELKLSQTKFIDPKNAQKLGKGLAAEHIMTGSYILAGDTLRLDARVIQVQSGKVLASEKVEGKKDEFFALEKDLVDVLVKILEIKLTSADKGKLRSNPTQSYEAWSKYSAGLDARDHGDEEKARRLFQAALDADPNYRAARTASERLKVIFRREEAKQDAEFEALKKTLDPKAPDFATKIDKLLQHVGDDPGETLKRIELMAWLAEKDLTPTTPGLSRLPVEAMSLLSRMMDDPRNAHLSAPVCEYFIARYPAENLQAQCKVLLKVGESFANQPPAAKKLLTDRKIESLAEYGKEYEKMYEAALRLMALYVRKGARR